MYSQSGVWQPQGRSLRVCVCVGGRVREGGGGGEGVICT